MSSFGKNKKIKEGNMLFGQAIMHTYITKDDTWKKQNITINMELPSFAKGGWRATYHCNIFLKIIIY